TADLDGHFGAPHGLPGLDNLARQSLHRRFTRYLRVAASPWILPHRAIKRPWRQPLEPRSAGTRTLRRARSNGEHIGVLGPGTRSGQVAQENKIQRHGTFGRAGNLAHAL